MLLIITTLKQHFVMKMITTYIGNVPKRIASYISLNIKSRRTKQHQVRKYNYEQFMRYIIM